MFRDLFKILMGYFLVGCSNGPDPENNPEAEAFWEISQVSSAYSRVFDDTDAPDPILYGIWRSNGYGFILEITPKKAAQYMETSSFCYLETDNRESVEDIFKYRLTDTSDENLYLTMFPGSGVYKFTRLQTLPDHCAKNDKWTDEEVLEVFLEYLGENYAFFEKRGVDWTKEAEKVRKIYLRNPGEGGLFEAMDFAIEVLDDPHTEVLEAAIGDRDLEAAAGLGKTRQALFATPQSEANEDLQSLDLSWLQDFRRRIAEDLLQGKGTRTGRGQIDWGEINDDVGYIQFLTFSGFSREEGIEASLKALHEALDEAIGALSGKKAIVVDATQNRGGIDLYARAAAGHFANERHLVFTKDVPSSTGGKRQGFYIEVEGESRFSGTVYFVTSDVTVSAGEIFTLAMRSLPNVIHVGETTRGALSDELGRRLPNGWAIGLASEIVLDSKGLGYEVSGIPPDVEYRIFDPENLFSDAHINAIRKIADDFKAGLLPQK